MEIGFVRVHASYAAFVTSAAVCALDAKLNTRTSLTLKDWEAAQVVYALGFEVGMAHPREPPTVCVVCATELCICIAPITITTINATIFNLAISLCFNVFFKSIAPAFISLDLSLSLDLSGNVYMMF